ncbi:putative HPP family protein [Magnetofaba australis IT-1]|uniref:Putative HPP family protein n=2 Tax=Magnetofaba TaxID=1472292 RepID=A0A1Y2JZ85_9PROT|nr:putative HPP family protein [Magnetofaba australis IT-1]
MTLSLLIGSFGASAVLLYGVPDSPLAQPRNVLGGHLISGVVGVIVQQAIGGPLWLVAALAVSVAIMAMILTRTTHPPGGATALIAVMGSPDIEALGFLYPIVPAFTGALCLLAVALISNNFRSAKRYPTAWW